jgi:hypothetical protein
LNLTLGFAGRRRGISFERLRLAGSGMARPAGAVAAQLPLSGS